MSVCPASVPRSQLRQVSAGIGLAVLFVVAALVLHTRTCVWVDAAGSRVADTLSLGVQLLQPAPAPADIDPFAFIDSAGVDASPPARARKNGRGQGHSQSTGHGVRISAAQVLALAERRAMPRAVAVPATAQHPAGLMLGAVSGLGVGMRDGDILIEAAGLKATSVATVIGAVLAARARKATEISGRFFRAGEVYQLTVEQPYPQRLAEPAPEAGSSSLPG